MTASRGDDVPAGVPRYDELDLRDAAQVCGVLAAGARASLEAPCRRGSTDVVAATRGDRLVATGDLHDNPLHLARLVEAAGLLEPGRARAHLTLHEVIHGGNLVNEMDFSYRALVRVAALKAACPEHVHTLLANHELSQIVGAGVVKDGVSYVRAFNDAVEFTFGDRAGEVQAAIGEFVRSLPLALRFETATGTVLCAHSLPGPDLMDRFDPGVLERELAPGDYVPRRGSAHIMVWGRDQTPEQLAALAERWRVAMFVLGHEKADDGMTTLGPNAVVLNSDHERGVYLLIDGAGVPTPAGLPALVRRLSP